MACLKPSGGSYNPTLPLYHLLIYVIYKENDEPNNQKGVLYKIEGSAAKPFTSELTERKRVTRNIDFHSHIAEHHRLT